MNASFRAALLAAGFVYLQLVVQFVFRTAIFKLDGGEILGTYAHAEAVFGILLVVGSMGLGVGLVRGTKEPADYWPAAGAALFYWCCLSCVGAMHFALFESGQAKMFLVIAAASNVVGAQLMAIWSFVGRIAAFNGLKLIASCASVLVVGLASLEYLTATQFTGFFLLVALSATVASIGFIPELRSTLSAPALIRGTRVLCFDVLPASRAFWASLIATVVYGRLDIVVLGVLGRPAVEIGEYSYVYGLFAAACLLPATVQKCLERPLLSSQLDGPAFIRKWMFAYFAIGLIVAVVFGAALPLMLGQVMPFTNSARSLFLTLTPAIVFVYVANPLGLVLMTNGQERHRAIIQWVGAGVNLVGNLLVISKWGAIGAGWTTSASYGVLYVGYLIACVRGEVWRGYRFRLELGLYGAASLLLFVILFARQ